MKARVHIPVDTHLSNYVTSIWEVSGLRNVSETILPQGIVELVFNLGDGMDGLLPGGHSVIQAPACFIQGMHTSVVSVEYSGQQHLFGVRLQPGMLKSLLGFLPFEFNNIIVDLALIKPAFQVLWYKLKVADSFKERVKLVENAFPALDDPDCIRTQQLCKLFISGKIDNFQSPESLSKQVFYSPRQLNRKVQAVFGVCTGELVTYKKYLHAVQLIHCRNRSLTDVAYDSGFYDQAHFCRVFKQYTGFTAKQYQQAKSDLPYHIFS